MFRNMDQIIQRDILKYKLDVHVSVPRSIIVNDDQQDSTM